MIRGQDSWGIWVIVLLALIVSAAEAQDAVDSVLSLDRGWARAYATHDTALADVLFSSDMVVTSSSGQLKDKAGELADVRPAPDFAMEYFRTRDVAARHRESTVVLTGIAEWAFRFKGTRSELRRRYTAVYVRGGRLGWQILALQLGPAPPAAPAG